LVQEYLSRKALSEIGYTFDGGALPYYKSEAFIAIASEIEKMKVEAAKKRRGR
jgi:hypothetical protein